jgi:anti-sigma-K factor RskA
MNDLTVKEWRAVVAALKSNAGDLAARIEAGLPKAGEFCDTCEARLGLWAAAGRWRVVCACRDAA